MTELHYTVPTDDKIKRIKDFLPKSLTDVKNQNNFSSGIEYVSELLDFAKETIFDKETREILDDFIASGGKFRLVENTNAYDAKDNVIQINASTLLKAFEHNKEKEIYPRLFIHELNHYSVIKKEGLREYYSSFDKPSVAVINDALEIAAFNKEIVSHFEAGGEHWKYYKKMQIIPEKMENFLKEHNVNPGDNIPKHLQSPIADLVFTGYNNYSLTKNIIIGDRYKSSLLKNMITNPTIGSGEKSVNPKEFFHKIGLPISFSDEIIKENLYFNKEMLIQIGFPSGTNNPISNISKQERLDKTEKALEKSFKNSHNLNISAMAQAAYAAR